VSAARRDVPFVTPAQAGVQTHAWIPAFAGMTAIALLAVPLPAQTTAQRVAQFDAYVAQAVRDWHVPGLAIAVVQGDSVILARGYGVRELGKPGAVDAGTRFAIGSTTKAMTAAALGMLVDEGKLRWDDPVTKHLPDFRLSDPWVTREITVRDLLTHRAGLGNADMLWADDAYSTDEIIRRVGALPLAYSMRSGWVYQNIMYAVAGKVVERVSGMPWETFLRTRLFQPLGMTATEPLLAGLAGQPNVAAPHGEIGDSLRVIQNRSVDPVKAAGSVWSSVGDMAKWMRFVLDSGRVGGKRLLAPTTFRELLTPQTIADPAIYPTFQVIRPHFITYGLGWFLHDYAGQAVAMHTGSIDGMSAIIGLIPDRRLGVYVLANADHAELRHALMLAAFDRFAGTAATPPRDWSAELQTLYGGARERALAAQRQQEQRRAADSRPSLPVARYAGTYTDPTFGDVTVTEQNGALRLAYGKGRVGDLSHWQYDTFRARWTDPRLSPSLVVFDPDGMGGVSGVRAFGISFQRVRQGTP
jgi:CubicO group peptidase (beta-lactamase class C family)